MRDRPYCWRSFRSSRWTDAATQTCSFHRHSGTPRSGGPGIHTPQLWLWIPGAPRNDSECAAPSVSSRPKRRPAREPGPVRAACAPRGAWVPDRRCAPSGMTPEDLASVAISRSDSIIKQQLSNSHAGSPVLFEAPGTPLSQIPPANKRGGAERRKAHQLPRPLARNAARPRPLAIEDARLAALHTRPSSLRPGTALPCADGGHWPHLIPETSVSVPPQPREARTTGRPS
jgi:hypothetical protein